MSEEEDTDKDLSKSGSLRSQYLLVLATAQRDDDVVEYTIKQLQSRGLSCQRVLSDKTNSILVSASFNLLAKQVHLPAMNSCTSCFHDNCFDIRQNNYSGRES